jgi:hypothetical protein
MHTDSWRGFASTDFYLGLCLNRFMLLNITAVLAKELTKTG